MGELVGGAQLDMRHMGQQYRAIRLIDARVTYNHHPLRAGKYGKGLQGDQVGQHVALLHHGQQRERQRARFERRRVQDASAGFLMQPAVVISSQALLYFGNEGHYGQVKY